MKKYIDKLVKQEAEEQLLQEQRIVDYDTKEYTVGVLVERFKQGDLFVPPYQRKLVWKAPRQWKFVESVLLGLPIPFLFCAELEDGRLEIVDGSQRVQTLVAFCDGNLAIGAVEKLDLMEGFTINDLSLPQQRRFRNRSIRMVALSQKADLGVRFDIFERINTGSLDLRPSELRKGAFAGQFYSLVTDCAQNQEFKRLCPLSKGERDREEAEELVLRFFAYSEGYQQFQHGVRTFLDAYIKQMNLEPDQAQLRVTFDRMLAFVGKYFPYGFRKGPNAKTTPRVRFEAISVGVHLALQIDPSLVPKNLDWLQSDAFKEHVTSVASNSRPKLRGRIEYVRDQLLGRQ